ncbi:MAG: polynucleotide adenylyltransferase PcnB [Gammaproteobacteria bacterium]|nr:polynucleotide adenylyltransferase PcnB [Gammaproteobacteria bacterium]
MVTIDKQKVIVISNIEIIARSQHQVSRKHISDNALKVLSRLRRAGYDAYLVGGCVRDLLIGKLPKDFDVSTNAHPEQVKDVFKNCRLIGRRFRLAHIYFGREVIEVATFRAPHHQEGESLQHEDGRILRDNVYGTEEEDAWRRDFTVNALYYDIADFSIRDHVGAMADIESRTLRMIGEPSERYKEDPVRMLRAIRFAAKLDFTIEPATQAPIKELGSMLKDIPSSRLFDELLKLFHGASAVKTFQLLRDYDLLRYLFPLTDDYFKHNRDSDAERLVIASLTNTDARIAEGKSVTPAFLFAAMLWGPMLAELDRMSDKVPQYQAIQIAADQLLATQLQYTSIPRRFSVMMREIWQLQSRFETRWGKRPWRLLAHPRFRAAYDFLVLRANAGEVEPELATWWTEFQECDEIQQKKMLKKNDGPKKRRRKPQTAASG